MEIKLSLKACQVSAFLSPSRVVQVHTRVLMPCPLRCRFTSSTCALRMQNTPGNCGWCERETSPTASHDASTPGALSKLPPLKPARTPKDAHLSAAILFFSNPTASPPRPAKPELLYHHNPPPLPNPQKQNWPEYCCYVKVENSLLRFKRCTEGS